jgi:hypothetical protein
VEQKPLYTDSELTEIERFLRDSYLKTTAQISSARPGDADLAVRQEKTRLGEKFKSSRQEVTADDIKELEEAINGPYAPDLKNLRQRALEDFKKNIPEKSVKDSFPLLFLKHILRRLCEQQSPKPQSAKILISSGGLAWLMQQLQMPPIYAPVIVWLATKLRDLSVPAFCGALKEYLKH